MGVFSRIGQDVSRQFHRDIERTEVQFGRQVARDVSGAVDHGLRELLHLPQHRGGRGYGGYGGYDGVSHPSMTSGGGWGGGYQTVRRDPNRLEFTDETRAAIERQNMRRAGINVPDGGNNLYKPDPAAEAQRARYEELRRAAEGGKPVPPVPSASPASDVPATTAPAVAPKPVDLAVQQQQAYLKVLGYDTGKLDGIASRTDGKQSKTEAALAKFAADQVPPIDPKDKGAVNRALLEQVQHSAKVQAFMDGAKAHPNALKPEDIKAVQWVLKGQGTEMPRSERDHGTKMDGQMGSETRTALQKPHDYIITERRSEAAPATVAPAVSTQRLAPVSPALSVDFAQAANADAQRLIVGAQLQARGTQTLARDAIETARGTTPSAQELTAAGGLKAEDFTGMRGGAGAATLTNAAPAADAGVQHKEQYAAWKRSQQTPSM